MEIFRIIYHCMIIRWMTALEGGTIIGIVELTAKLSATSVQGSYQE